MGDNSKFSNKSLEENVFNDIMIESKIDQNGGLSYKEFCKMMERLGDLEEYDNYNYKIMGIPNQS